MWIRNCPKCDTELHYTKKNSFNKATRLKTNCLSCSNRQNRSEYSQRLATSAIVKKRLYLAETEFVQGTIFGDRTVVSSKIFTGLELGFKTGNTWYVQVMCKCGKLDWVRIHSLRQHSGKSCIRCCQSLGRSPTFKGHEDMPGRIMSRIKGSAQARTHTKGSINFTAKYIYELFHSQNCKCKFTNMPLDWSTASLDRIDSARGYEMGNVQWVHKKVNLMKLDMTDTEFVNWCKLIVGNLI